MEIPFFEKLHAWKCLFIPSHCIFAVYSISCIDCLFFFFKVWICLSMTMFWNRIVWVGMCLFSFIVLTGNLNLEDHLLLWNSGKFSYVFYYLFSPFSLFALSENIICVLNLLDRSLILIIFFSFFLFLVYFFSSIIRFIL